MVSCSCPECDGIFVDMDMDDMDDNFQNLGDANVLCQSTKDVTVELNCINQCVCLVGILTWLGSQP